MFYSYGGIFEKGPREYTLDDFYSLQLDKLDRYTCLKASDITIAEGDEESSSDEDDEDDDEDDDETVDDRDETESITVVGEDEEKAVDVLETIEEEKVSVICLQFTNICADH